MKVKILKPTEIELKRVELVLPFDSDDDVPENFPGRDDSTETLTFSIDLDTFQIADWPAERTPCYLNLMPRDSGVYRVFDADGNLVKTIEDYVPHCLIPGSYGDYVELKIDASGKVKNMRPDSDDLRQLARLIDGVKLED